MIKVLFVCLGNICRSPMAEFVFKEMVRRENLQDSFYISSAATSSEEIGNGMHYGAIRKMQEEGIPISNRSARKMTKQDYEEYDYIIGMEDRNVRNILGIVGGDAENKVYKLLDFSDNPRDIADPWYTRNFDKAYDDIVEGCEAFLNEVKKEL
jgi:protein-tyrosine phosphatase